MKTKIFTFEEYFKNEAKKTQEDEDEVIDGEVIDDDDDDNDDDEDDEEDKPKKRTTKVAKGEGVEALLKIFKEKPVVKMTSSQDEKGAYSIAGLKAALKDKYTSTQVDQFIYELQNDKTHKNSLKSIKIKEFKHGELYPYFYIGEFDAETYKEKMEKASKAKYAVEHSKKQEMIKRQQKQRDEKEAAKEKRKTTKSKKEVDPSKEGEEVKPKGKRGRPSTKGINESIMRFKDFTFGVKEGLNDEIISSEYGMDDSDTYTMDSDVYDYDKVMDVLNVDYHFIVDDSDELMDLFEDFEDSEFFDEPVDEYEYASQFIEFYGNKK